MGVCKAAGKLGATLRDDQERQNRLALNDKIDMESIHVKIVSVAEYLYAKPRKVAVQKGRN